MDLLVIRESVSKNVKKFIGIGSVNCYPSLLEAPYEEEDLWGGQPHDSVLGYGSSKRNLILQCQMLRSQQKLNATVLIFEGVYGPGDNYSRGRSRVIPANIVRCIDAINSGITEISVWGTGNPIRDFLFVDDASRAIIFSVENSDNINSLNVGSGMPVSIRELLEKIVQVTGFEGKLVWDESKPDGQKIRYLSNRKVLDLFPRLRDRKNQLGNTLSGGEQQMLSIGRALITNPKLLILDEATEGLAPFIQEEIWKVLSSIKEEGMSILIVDKSLKKLSHLADYFYLVVKGEIGWQGEYKEISEETIRKYLSV